MKNWLSEPARPSRRSICPGKHDQKDHGHKGGGLVRVEGKWGSASGEVDEATAARIKALRIPPAWRNVELNPDPKAALQATGTDSKGRRQYLYSAEHSAKMAAEKTLEQLMDEFFATVAWSGTVADWNEHLAETEESEDEPEESER